MNNDDERVRVMETLHCVHCGKAVRHVGDDRPVYVHVETKSEMCRPDDIHASYSYVDKLMSRALPEEFTIGLARLGFRQLTLF